MRDLLTFLIGPLEPLSLMTAALLSALPASLPASRTKARRACSPCAAARAAAAQQPGKRKREGVHNVVEILPIISFACGYVQEES